MTIDDEAPGQRTALVAHDVLGDRNRRGTQGRVAAGAGDARGPRARRPRARGGAGVGARAGAGVGLPRSL